MLDAGRGEKWFAYSHFFHGYGMFNWSSLFFVALSTTITSLAFSHSTFLFTFFWFYYIDVLTRFHIDFCSCIKYQDSHVVIFTYDKGLITFGLFIGDQSSYSNSQPSIQLNHHITIFNPAWIREQRIRCFLRCMATWHIELIKNQIP